MLYIGFDGTGYQTGLASSEDLFTGGAKLSSARVILLPYTKFNLAISSILRDKNLHGTGEAIKIGGEYFAAWNAYPSSGMKRVPQSLASRAHTTSCTGR